jgi:hypothetical protein
VLCINTFLVLVEAFFDKLIIIKAKGKSDDYSLKKIAKCLKKIENSTKKLSKNCFYHGIPI